jgi:hypothetical protein
MFHWLTTMQHSWSSLLHREAAAIRIGLAQLGFPYHTTYVGLGLQTQTYIYQPVPRSPKTKPVCATREHSTPLHCVVRPWRIHRSVLHGTSTISIHPVCMSFRVKDKLGQGLLEYVASTTSHDHRQLYNDRSLINIGGVTMSGLKPCKNMIILMHQVYQSFRIT